MGYRGGQGKAHWEDDSAQLSGSGEGMSQVAVQRGEHSRKRKEQEQMFWAGSTFASFEEQWGIQCGWSWVSSVGSNYVGEGKLDLTGFSGPVLLKRLLSRGITWELCWNADSDSGVLEWELRLSISKKLWVVSLLRVHGYSMNSGAGDSGHGFILNETKSLRSLLSMGIMWLDSKFWSLLGLCGKSSEEVREKAKRLGRRLLP